MCIRDSLEIDYQQPDEGNLVAYATPELTEDLIIAGPGYLDLWVKPGSDNGAVQVDLTEVRPDGSETYVQSGWHELQHAEEYQQLSDDYQVEYTFTEEGREVLEPAEWVHRRVDVYKRQIQRWSNTAATARRSRTIPSPAR